MGEAKPSKVRKGEKVAVVLSGGSRQIAKADGDAPVLAGIRSREQATGKPASRLIDQRIRDLGDGAGRPWPACGR